MIKKKMGWGTKTMLIILDSYLCYLPSKCQSDTRPFSMTTHRAALDLLLKGLSSNTITTVSPIMFTHSPRIGSHFYRSFLIP